MADRAYLERLTRELADKGKLIEAGWVAMRLHAIPLNAPPTHLQEMRLAFMGGAQHLFASIMGMLDPQPEVTPDDMKRMDLIHQELEAFRGELELWVTRTKGSG